MFDTAIRSVTRIDEAGAVLAPAVTDLPTVTKYKFTQKNIGGSSDRRTARRKAVNKRIGFAAVLSVEWSPVTAANAAKILQAFRSKYVRLEYLDAEAGTWQTDDFVVDGDRDLDLLDADVLLWSGISFTLEQRTPDYD